MLQPQLRLQSCLVTNASGASCGNTPNPSLEWDLLLDLHWRLPPSTGRTLVSNNGIASKKTHFSLSKSFSRLLLSKDRTRVGLR